MTRVWIMGAVLAVCAWSAARGDVFYLKDGGVIDGEVISETPERIEVRVAQGVVAVAPDQVERRETMPPPWERFETEKEKYPDTAQGHYDLAMWCRRNRLTALMNDELRRSLEHDPDFEPSREALGYIRHEGLWVKKPRPRPEPPPPEEAERLRQEKLIRDIITQWFIRIRAIRTGRFDGRDRDETSPLFQDGRRQILEIKDPLAIPALSSVLSGGSEPTRRLLIESLTRFPQDEATMNLLVMSVFDPSPAIRRSAAVELIPRKDERLVTRLREALRSDEEEVLRNAAGVLGVIKAEEAVEDLTLYLETKVRARVSVPRTVYFNNVYRAYCQPWNTFVGGQRVIYAPTGVGVLSPGTVVGTYWTTEVQTVSIYRTEVQEALIAITDQNFGFDADAWRRWWRTSRE
jgi:hypothetical protein